MIAWGVVHARVALLLLVACAAPPADPGSSGDPDVPLGDTAPHEVLVAPYLQSFTPTSGWICWETADGEESVVEYGLTEALGAQARATATAWGHGMQHEVHLEGLTPDTVYWYLARTGATRSEPAHFRTPPAVGAGAPFRLVAMSDMQRDDARPLQWAQVVEQGVIPWVTGAYDADLPTAVGLVLIAGDLVDSGWMYDDWTTDFFPGAAPLSRSVPFYPVLGNHEGNSPAYFQYMHLPEDGTPGFEEHWWTTDYQNVRVVGLDSNEGYASTEQLEWLDEVLERTCTDDTIEFVFAELHHPYLSELWNPGELDWTGEVVARMEAFSTACGKPSVHFFGHTHGYSRGQSREHAHLWVNVGSAGGALDRWGADGQTDYEAFSNSQDAYGFVVVEAEPGAFTLRRLSLGTPEAPTEAVVTDELTVRLAARPPATPEAVGPVDRGVVGANLELVASSFSHPEGGAHGASWWQVSADCTALSAPVVDRWEQHENWYGGVDTRAGLPLDRLAVEALAPGVWCWRVRYRDRGLAWSAWSTPAAFVVEGA